jgi:hypothetical protein
VGPGATVLIFDVRMGARNPRLPPPAIQTAIPDLQADNFSSKLLANFKLPTFDGISRNWKPWNKTFIRFLAIHQLDGVIEETFVSILPLTPRAFAANKMVYYLLEDAIVPSSLAAKYFRLAAKWNGNEAYSRLFNGYVFSGPQTMSLLLSQLVNLRFKANESASGFCLRLREIFEDLEMAPGPSAIFMNDTQKIGYLLSGIRQERSLQAVYVALQDKQLRGAVTFEESCEDLHARCEALRADEMLATPVHDTNPKVLVSTQGKRQNKVAKATTPAEMAPCLQKDCHEMVKSFLPLCPLHYHQCISGKTATVDLKDGLATAKFNASTQVIDYPSAVPKHRFPLLRAERGGGERKALVSFALPTLACQSSVDCDPSHSSDFTTFYVDSGAGQCLCSCSSAFLTMEACHLQVVGVTGRLSIHGLGTAVFLVSVDGREALLRIHNCLHSFGEFNLLSVSQLKLVPGNSIDFSLVNPMLKLSTGQLVSSNEDFIAHRNQTLEVPLVMDAGLYSLVLEPISPSDPRYDSLPIFDVTPPGLFCPLTQCLAAVSYLEDDAVDLQLTVLKPEDRCPTNGEDRCFSKQMWTTTVLSFPTRPSRVLAMPSKLDFDEELRTFSDSFLAPVAIPPARRQYDVAKPADMTELSIRFMGAGTDRIIHTVGISNGLNKPPSKTLSRVPPKLFPQGRLKRSKTPIVSKGKVGHLHTATIAEVLSTDTFESGDHRFPLGQAFVDHASR